MNLDSLIPQCPKLEESLGFCSVFDLLQLGWQSGGIKEFLFLNSLKNSLPDFRVLLQCFMSDLRKIYLCYLPFMCGLLGLSVHKKEKLKLFLLCFFNYKIEN